jgi:hypothetical protein
MNFVQAVQALIDAGVEFAIIGGWSAIMHGSAHLTNHLDLCYSRTPANLRRLARALAPYHPGPAGFPPELPFVWSIGPSTAGLFSPWIRIWAESTFWRKLRDWEGGMRSVKAVCG